MIKNGRCKTAIFFQEYNYQTIILIYYLSNLSLRRKILKLARYVTLLIIEKRIINFKIMMMMNNI